MEKLISIVSGIVAYFVGCWIAEYILLSTLNLATIDTFHLMLYTFMAFSSITVLIIFIGIVINGGGFGVFKDFSDIDEVIYGCFGYVLITASIFAFLYSYFPYLLVIILYHVVNIGIMIRFFSEF